MEKENLELEELKKKNEEYLNGWKRERADFLNYKKEEMERINGLVKYANEEIILNFLPILDNLMLAQKHIADEGLAQVLKQFLDLLKKEGIEPIECIGKPFDPATMEVIEEIESGGSPASAKTGEVVEEAQAGYTMHGKLIRPAKVKISK